MCSGIVARLGDQLLLVTDHESFHIDELGRLVATGLTRPDAAEVYIEPFQFWPKGGYWQHNYELAGRWPDGVWALFQGAGYERIRVPRAVIQRKGREWIPHDTFEGEAEWNYGAIFEWKDGQVLGLRIDGVRQAPLGQGGYAVLAARDRPPGARFDVLGDRIEPAWPQIDPELIFVAAATAAKGELFVAGFKDDGSDRGVFVQRWDPNGGPPTGVVDELPWKFAIHRLVVGAGDHAYLAGADAETAYLVAFDGVTWSQEPVPEGRWIRDLALAPGGDLWAVVELESTTALFRRRAGRSWERVTLSAVDLPVGERWKYDRDWRPERVPRVAADGPPPVQPVRVEAADALAVSPACTARAPATGAG